MRIFALSSIALLLLVIPRLGQASDWVIDPSHSTIQFKVRHLMISNVRGTFGKFEGKITVDEKNPENSRVEATIEVASIDTGLEKRDEHLRGPDFFDVASFPRMTYISKSVKKAANGKYRIAGGLTMHGVTREVVLEMEAPSMEIKDLQGKPRRGTSATARLNRKDFGLTWNKPIETGGMVVGEEIEISMDLEMVKP